MRTQSLVPAGTLYQAIPHPSLRDGVQSAVGPECGNLKDLTYLQREGEGTVRGSAAACQGPLGSHLVRSLCCSPLLLETCPTAPFSYPQFIYGTSEALPFHSICRLK